MKLLVSPSRACTYPGNRRTDLTCLIFCEHIDIETDQRFLNRFHFRYKTVILG